MTDDPQAVTDDPGVTDAPNAGTEGTPEVPGAQDTTGDEWDEILKDSQPEPDKPTPEPAAKSGDEAPVSRAEFNSLRDAMSKKDTDEGINAAVSNIKAGNEALKGIPDRFVKFHLFGLADERKEVLKAFGDRRQNPKAWERAQELIGKDLAKAFADMPNAELTEGVAAAAAAVRGVSTTQPPAQGKLADSVVNAMSDAELAAYKTKLDGAAAGG